MRFLSCLLVAAPSMIVIIGASSSDYDLIVFPVYDRNFLSMGTENFQEADLFSEPGLGSEQADLYLWELDPGFHQATFT